MAERVKDDLITHHHVDLDVYKRQLLDGARCEVPQMAGHIVGSPVSPVFLLSLIHI